MITNLWKLRGQAQPNIMWNIILISERMISLLLFDFYVAELWGKKWKNFFLCMFGESFLLQSSELYLSHCHVQYSEGTSSTLVRGQEVDGMNILFLLLKICLYPNHKFLPLTFLSYPIVGPHREQYFKKTFNNIFLLRKRLIIYCYSQCNPYCPTLNLFPNSYLARLVDLWY
jgi:hypothetical protein